MSAGRLISVVFVFLLVGGRQATHADDAKNALVGMLNCRAKLVSGRCSITGVWKDRPGRADSDESELLLVFDFSSSVYRFTEVDRGVFLSTSEFRYSAGERAGVRRYELGDNPTSGVMPFDIRTLGFYPRPNDVVFEQDGLDFAPMVERLMEAKIIESENDVGLIRLTLELPLREGDHYVVKMRVWIDPDEGFTTTRIEEVHPDSSSDVTFFSEMDWTQVGDIWVMDAFHQEAGKRHTPYSVSWKLEWRDVNQEIAPSEFELKKLIPEGREGPLYYIDFPSNKLVELDIISNRRPVDKTRSVTSGNEEVSPRSLSFLMFGVGLLLLMVAVLVVARKGSRIKRPKQ